MKIRSAFMGVVVAASSMLGGCAQKTFPDAQKVFKKTQKELFLKQKAGNIFTKEDSVLFNAVKNVEKANSIQHEASARKEYALSNLIYQKDSIEISKKARKTKKDTAYLHSLEMRRNVAEFFSHIEKAIVDYKKGVKN